MEARNTIQRALVLRTVQKTAGHATADEIYQMIAGEHSSISRGTVYRNLQRLCETGEIRKVEVPGGADRYDCKLEDHYHVKCEKCGRIFDVDMEYMPELEQEIKDRHGFILYGHSIMFRGICPGCQQYRKEDNEN